MSRVRRFSAWILGTAMALLSLASGAPAMAETTGLIAVSNGRSTRSESSRSDLDRALARASERMNRHLEALLERGEMRCEGAVEDAIPGGLEVCRVTLGPEANRVLPRRVAEGG